MKNPVLKMLFLFVILTATSEVSANTRRPLITEQFYAQKSDQRYLDTRAYHHGTSESNRNALLWQKLSIEQGIEPLDIELERYGNQDCHFETAVSIYETLLAELEADAPYIKIWAGNQNRVFSACSRYGALSIPRKPDFEDLPVRARTDFQYQLASWNFYQRDYEEALSFYEGILDAEDAPIKPYAAYMVARSLAEIGKKEEAYEKIEELLKDQSMKPVHAIAANYKFILMYDAGPYAAFVSNELAEQHLNWLLDVVRVNPKESSNLENAYQRYFDALYHLDRYFPLYDPDSKAIDWWLTNNTFTSPRMSTVQKYSKQNELVDWMQAKWAYNVFDKDWIWALHDQDNPYWGQNKNIVSHAWDKWSGGGGLEWLQIAVSRVHPEDPLSAEILEAAKPYFARNSSGETSEYKTWLHEVWKHSVRLRLARGDIKAALELINDKQIKNLKPQRAFENNDYDHAYTLNNAIRWLVYVGSYDEARKILNASLQHYPGSFKHWRTLLSEDHQDQFLFLSLARSYGSANVGNDEQLQLKIFNLLPLKLQYELRKSLNFDDEQSKTIAWALLAKVFLLGQDNQDEIVQYAASKNPAHRSAIFKAYEGSAYDEVELMLRLPRMRPVPFTLADGYYSWGKESDPEKVDYFHHSDNNWWCTVNQKDLENAVFEAARIRPNSRRSLLNAEVTEFEAYDYRLRDFLKRHPYTDLLNPEELRYLEAIPNGPKFLSEAVIGREKIDAYKFWRSGEAKLNSAANLHYAVRTTRYGCERNGSHAEYSQKAYKILHDNYPETSWGQITPYWFSDKHFRYSKR